MTTLAEVTQNHPEAAHCDALYEVRDEAVGLRAFIALHDLSRGPGYGGIRRRHYPSTRAAVHEVVGLAEQMTLKTAFANLSVGGAKAVILDCPECERPRMYERLGEAIERLDGAFVAGADVGTADSELQALRHTAHHVTPAGARPAQSAATGVVLGCREALAFVGAPERSRAVVAGVGSVGSLVARGLAEAGFELAVSDIDSARAQAVARELGARVMTPEEALTAETELFAPCAIGPAIRRADLSRLRMRVICGSANNQLEDDTLAHALAEQDILYIPDFTVNAGAVIEGVLRRAAAVGLDPQAEIDEAIRAIGPRIRALLEAAREQDMTPLEQALMRL